MTEHIRLHSKCNPENDPKELLPNLKKKKNYIRLCFWCFHFIPNKKIESKFFVIHFTPAWKRVIDLILREKRKRKCWSGHNIRPITWPKRYTELLRDELDGKVSKAGPHNISDLWGILRDSWLMVCWKILSIKFQKSPMFFVYRVF